VKIYLSGRMRGVPDLNFPAFNAAAQKLRLEGHEVFNPAAANLEKLPIRRIFLHDMAYICLEADAVALLPGWRKSKGAKAEKALAEAIGIQVIELAREKK
jgi:hypothetical protein